MFVVPIANLHELSEFLGWCFPHVTPESMMVNGCDQDQSSALPIGKVTLYDERRELTVEDERGIGDGCDLIVQVVSANPRMRKGSETLSAYQRDEGSVLKPC